MSKEQEQLYIREQIGGLRSDVKNLATLLESVINEFKTQQTQITALQAFKNRALGSITVITVVVSAIASFVLYIGKKIIERFVSF